MSKSKRIITLFLVALCVLMGSILSAPTHAVGGEGGGGEGGGGITGCETSWFLATCYGAGWRYYSTTSDNVPISGTESIYSNPSSQTISPGGHIVGCGKYGGYWRYAMIAQNSNYGYSAGQQVGISSFGFGGAASASYASTHYSGGGMVYRGADLSTVRAAWSKAYNSENFTYNGSNPNWDDPNNDLGWFCSGDGTEDEPCTECGCPGIPCPPEPDPISCPISYPSYNPTKDSGTTFSVTAIKNTNVPAYSSWQQQLIYAKPTDNISWVHCYFPGIQAVRITPGDHPHPSPGNRNDAPPLTNTVEGQTKIAATSNKFTINTQIPSYLQNSINITVTGNGFSGSSSASGEVGSTNTAVANSAPNPVNREAEGKTIKQGLNTQHGTYSADGHSTWTYTYTQDHYGASALHCGTTPTLVGEIIVPVPNTCAWTTTEIGTGHHNQNFYKLINSTSSGESSSQSVYVPYNFTTATQIDNISDNPVYAGESTTVSYHVDVNTRQNNTTKGNYATKTPDDTIVRLVSFSYTPSTGANSSLVTGNSNVGSDPCSFYGGKGAQNCKVVDQHNGSLSTNTGSNGLGEATTHNYNTSASIYDAPAGTKFCVAVGINHADSGNDTNNNGAGTVNNNWNISNASCRTIVKKPSMQVWGASIYTSGNINTSAAKKTYYNNSGSTHLFSSWVEYGIITNGKVNFGNNSGLASGASTGYQSAYTGTPITGGLTQYLTDYCYRSPLTISNKDCNNIGQSSITLNTTFLERLKSRFFVENRSEYTFSGSNLNLLTSHKELESGTGYRYTRVNGTATITSAPTLTNGATHIVYATGDINIDTNLLYSDSPVVTGLSGTGYSSISQIPQYIIYSESGNINISKDVTHIDAWLIAPNGTVNTCPNFVIGTSSTYDCPNQLVVNGPVIAKNLVLNRTYGGDNGTSSATPAEIFNLTSATYLWAYSQARNYPQAFTTYMRQLAPRY